MKDLAPSFIGLPSQHKDSAAKVLTGLQSAFTSDRIVPDLVAETLVVLGEG